MSTKRAAKQLRRAQKRKHLNERRAMKPNPRVGMVINWLRNAGFVKRPDWVSDRIWQLVVNALPRRQYSKLRNRAQAKTLGINTRSY